jgi:hypothetical protein
MQSRVLFVAGLAAVLAALIVAVVALSGGEDRSFAEAPPDCVSAWNDNVAAVTLGRHQSSIHGYIDVEVLMLRADGSIPAAAESGPGPAHCAVVFAAGTLDPEVSAAAQVQLSGSWRALSDSASTERLAELQARASSAHNAQITPEGTVEPL